MIIALYCPFHVRRFLTFICWSLPRSNFLTRYLKASDAISPARPPSPNYSDSDCCICWSGLREGSDVLYKMMCCDRLVHLDCVQQVCERKSTSERRECVACYTEVRQRQMHSECGMDQS